MHANITLYNNIVYANINLYNYIIQYTRQHN